MKSLRHWGAAAGACLLLASCGGGGDDGPRVRYGKLVSFGDSLSDVGTHRTPGVAALGGGKYTVNGPGSKIEFADSVHPTPLGYLLLAQLVTARMVEKGWR